MKRRFLSVGIAAIGALGLFGPGTASAATEFGDTCSGNSAVPSPYTLTTLSAPAGALPLTAPISGVITKVKMQVATALPSGLLIPEQVKLLRSAGGNNFTVTNQTNINVGTGSNVAEARMPVQAGERLAVHGLPFTYEGSSIAGYEFYCGSGTEGTLGAVSGDVPQGSTSEFAPVTEGRVPLAAVIEPDADGDGFGDETQDGCPQSAATQAPCPAVTLDASATAKKKLVTVLVTSSTTANVTVSGKVSLGKGKKANINGGTQAVAPGAFTKFKLKFPAKLIKRLKELPPSKKLTLKVTSSAPNLAAPPTTSVIKVKLKGQG